MEKTFAALVLAVAASAVQASEAVTAALPGHFTKGPRAEVVVLHNNTAKLCRAPDYERCVPMSAALPARSTVAVATAGGTRLLVFDSAQSIRACTVSTRGNSASLDCATVDQTRLDDYNIDTVVPGRLLHVRATDGHYMCSADGGTMACLQTAGTDGVPIRKTRQQRQAERLFGVPIVPPGQDQPCLVKDGTLNCKPPRLGGADARRMFLRPVAIYEFEETEILGFRDTATQFLDSLIWTGQHQRLGEVHLYVNEPQLKPERPPNYWREQCLSACDRQDKDYHDVCVATSGLTYVLLGAPIAAGYYAACEAGRAYHSLQCRRVCDSVL